jgi:predicted anti-sigma-YlaC factor YlaD
MKLSCEVIRDLFPIYHDGVCSGGSKALVEEHLAQCEGCRAELKAMDAALPIETAQRNRDEAQAVEKLSKRWKKGMWKSLIKGVLLAIAAIAALLLVLYLFVDFKVIG